jgi:hypothetical protein
VAQIGSTFSTGEPALQELLEGIDRGIIQLPDFQRDWVWDDEHIRSLIASISRSFPIGAVMLLETGNPTVKFKPRPFEGAAVPPRVQPDQLVLDGQQRLTSLYLAIRSGKPVPVRTERKPRVYYLDMAQCLDPEADRHDAVISIPADRLVRSDFGRKVEIDLTSAEAEYALGYFPVELIFDLPHLQEWESGFRRHFNYAPDRMRLLDDFKNKVWLGFQQYRVPVIVMLKGTPKEAVCQVFEKVNTGGVSLTVFELVTATFAADDFRLREDWEARQAKLHAQSVLRSIQATDFLAAVTLLSSYRRFRAVGRPVSVKKEKILELPLESYRANADQMVDGFLAAAKLLVREKVFDDRNLPYATQLVPLAAVCAFLGKRVEEDPVKVRLARWLWCGVFGELYGGANETRYAFDMVDLVSWIDGGEEPRTIRDANFAPTRLLTMQTRGSAAYKGVMAQLMKAGSLDLISGDPLEVNNYFEEAVDIHHLFPARYCEERGLPRERWNTVINKAPITARTNRSIGGQAPSKYLAVIERVHKIAPARLDDLVRSHQASPEHLRNDDFNAFLRDRATRLLDLIERAMGKTVSGRESDEVIAAFGAPLTARPTT